MNDTVAKKYVKALTKSMNDDELVSTLESLKSLLPAFDEKKFVEIINSYEVLDSQKEQLVLSMFENQDEKFKKFISLLGRNKRLGDIPSIAKELSKQIALKNNQYEGQLISNFEVEDKELRDIEESISKKLNADIKLTNRVTDYPGIKVEVESLGLEISFSADRLKNQIAEHILNSL